MVLILSNLVNVDMSDTRQCGSMMCQRSYSVNTKRLYSMCTTPAQRIRRWYNIVQMLYKCFVFAG